MEYSRRYFGTGAVALSDKRRATWIAIEQARKDMRDCVKTDAAMYVLLGTNQKTGGNIKDGIPVKRDVLKNAINNFLRFLAQFEAGNGHTFDPSRHHEDDIKRISQKYIKGKAPVTWEALAEDQAEDDDKA